MSLIRPLFSDIKPIDIQLSADWQYRLVANQPKRVSFDQQELRALADWVRWYGHTVWINSNGAEPKHVLDYLNKIDRRSAKIDDKATDARVRSLRDSLMYPITLPAIRDKGRIVALDYLVTALHAQRQLDQGDPLTVPTVKDRDLLNAIIIDAVAAQWLRFHIRGIRRLLTMTPDQLEERMLRADGKLLIGGKPFRFTADPHWRPYCRPNGDAIDTLIQNLILSYRRADGITSVHKDGRNRSPTPFMRFLSNVASLIPHPRPTDDLHSRARQIASRPMRDHGAN